MVAAVKYRILSQRNIPERGEGMNVVIVKQVLDTLARGRVFAGERRRLTLCFGFGRSRPLHWEMTTLLEVGLVHRILASYKRTTHTTGAEAGRAMRISCEIHVKRNRAKGHSLRFVRLCHHATIESQFPATRTRCSRTSSLSTGIGGITRLFADR